MNNYEVYIELSLDEDIYHGREGNPHGNEVKVVLELSIPLLNKQYMNGKSINGHISEKFQRRLRQWELAKFRGATGRTGAEAVNVPLYLFAVQRILL